MNIKKSERWDSITRNIAVIQPIDRMSPRVMEVDFIITGSNAEHIESAYNSDYKNTYLVC